MTRLHRLAGCALAALFLLGPAHPALSQTVRGRIVDAETEAVEYYRSWLDAPLELMDYPRYIKDPSRCRIVALWPRQASD